jgi:GT2 family glycosyltransferase
LENNIAILIIFFNKLTQTISCIESFIPSGQNIYILNNASEPFAWNVLQKKFEKNTNINFYHSETNLGPAAGRNLLLKKCKEEWIFLVDNDICVKPKNNWRQLFNEQVAHIREAKIFCPRVFNVHENEYATKHRFTSTNGIVFMEETNEKITNYFSCCAVIINQSIFKTYGDFDEGLFAFEDYEFSIRAMLSSEGDLQIYPLDDIEVIHDHQFQKSKTDKKAVLERYNELKIQKSLDLIIHKHGITFEHEWQWWTRNQITKMNGQNFLGKVKRTVKNFFRRS